jgi:hypothetical protein
MQQGWGVSVMGQRPAVVLSQPRHGPYTISTGSLLQRTPAICPQVWLLDTVCWKFRGRWHAVVFQVAPGKAPCSCYGVIAV